MQVEMNQLLEMHVASLNEKADETRKATKDGNMIVKYAGQINSFVVSLTFYTLSFDNLTYVLLT